MFIVIVVFTLPITLLITFLPLKNKDVVMFYFVKFITNLWLLSCFIITKKINTQVINKKSTYVIIANHSSYIDAPSLYTSLSIPFKTLGKVEINKVPIFKYIYKSVVITVNRESTMARAKSFIHMQQVLSQAFSIVVFPEGTFDKNQTQLKNFHDGAFQLALKNGTSILPMLFLDANKRMQPETIIGFTPGINRVVFLPPISTQGFTAQQLGPLKNYCYTAMQDVLNYCKGHSPQDFEPFIKNYFEINKFA